MKTNLQRYKELADAAFAVLCSVNSDIDQNDADVRQMNAIGALSGGDPESAMALLAARDVLYCLKAMAFSGKMPEVGLYIRMKAQELDAVEE